MLQIRDLTITHKKDLRTLLSAFQLTLNEGDKAVLIGEEGDGKSTLLKWIYDPGLIEAYAEAAGERILAGERLAWLPQELPEAERARSVYEFFLEEEAFQRASVPELGRLAARFGLPGDVFYSPQRMDTLSGGEKVKLQLLRCLLRQPTVLLLDEPSNDLDLPTLEWLEGFIRSFPHVVLFISHDETLIEGTANVIVHLELLRRKTLPRFTVYKGSYAAYRESRTEAFRKQAQQAASDRREQKLRDEKYRRIRQSVERAQNAVSRQDPHGGRLLKKKMHAVKSMERRFERQDRELTEFPDEEEAISLLFADCPGLPAGKTVLDFSLPELRAAGEEGRLLARDLRLLVRGPEKVGIVGRNGAGKTTLLRLLAAELLPRTDLRAACMPQNYEDLLDPGKTPVEFLMTGGSREEETRIRTCLGSLKYTAAEMDHPLSELSGGQKAKVFLLGMSLSGANVLLLDEPTRNFSPLSGPVIRALLRDYPGAILSVSHDRKYLGEVCTRILRLTEDGLEEA